MTVKELRRLLEECNDDAVVFVVATNDKILRINGFDWLSKSNDAYIRCDDPRNYHAESRLAMKGDAGGRA